MKIALKLKLPLILHIRNAEEEGREVLREMEVPSDWPIHRHCFKRTWSEACSWLKLYPASKLGFTGLVTFGDAKTVHEVACHISLHHLLLEMDTPYCLPQKVSRATYKQSFAQPGHVTAQIAALQNISIGKVLRANRKNIEEVYNIQTGI